MITGIIEKYIAIINSISVNERCKKKKKKNQQNKMDLPSASSVVPRERIARKFEYRVFGRVLAKIKACRKATTPFHSYASSAKAIWRIPCDAWRTHTASPSPAPSLFTYSPRQRMLEHTLLSLTSYFKYLQSIRCTVHESLTPFFFFFFFSLLSPLPSVLRDGFVLFLHLLSIRSRSSYRYFFFFFFYVRVSSISL